MKRKFISIILVLLTLLNTVPLIGAVADEISYSGSDFSTNSTIAARLDEVLAEYVPGKHYFVSDGGNNLNGNKNYPCTASGNGCGYYSYSWQCLAYVRWVQNKLLGCDEWASSSFSELSGYSYATEANCKNWFQKNKDKLHPGAHIRFANHSIAYLSQDSYGVTFLHCNWGRTCMVKIATLSWADFANLFGYVNYCTYYTSYYTLFPENGTVTSRVPGIYKTIVPNSTLNLRSEPTTSSTVLDSIPHNTELTITEIQGNWGKTVYNGISGWISLDYAEFVEQFSYNIEYASDSKIEASTVTLGDTITIESNPDAKSGYSFIGWSLKRVSDGKWYTDNGWFTGTELNSNNYEKVLFAENDEITITEAWLNDIADNETFTFHPNWENVKLGIYKVITPGSTLNLRSEPTTSSIVLNSIPDGAELQITEISNNWGYTSYNNIKGWVSLDFVEFVSQFAEIQSLSIHTMPSKTTYYVGEKFSSTGLVLCATYNDGSQRLSTNYTYSSSYFQTSGVKDIVVSYEGLSVTVSVTVLPNPTITISDAYGVYGSKVSVPIIVSKDSHLGNGQFIIEFDSSALEFSGYSIGALLKNASVSVGKAHTDETIKIDFNSATAITSEGTLVILEFNVKSTSGSTTVSMGSMDLYTTSGYIAPSAFSNSNITIFSQVSNYDNLFKSITHTIDGENIVFTITTPAAALNRVKVALADDRGDYIKYTNSYVVNSNGECVWTLKILCPEAATQYVFDARSSETGKYLRDYYEYTVSNIKPNAIKSVSATQSGNKTIFTVVSQSGYYNRLRVGLNENLVDNLATTSTYKTDTNGDYIWTITIPSQEEGTIIYFDLRDAETNKYTKNCFEYEIDLLEEVIYSVSATNQDEKLVFTVVTESGNYSRLRVGPNKKTIGNLATSTKYTINASGEYVWTISMDMPEDNITLYFDLRDGSTNKYIENHYKYELDVTMFSDDIIKHIKAQDNGNKTTFIVTTAPGNYNRLRVGPKESLVGNLGVSNSYTVNSAGNYVWSITIPTPSESTKLYFDLRDADTNKYICQYCIYNLEV